MKNILKACFIGCFEIVFLFFVLNFAKDRGVDLRELSISSVLAQLTGMLFVPLVCLLVCRKEVRASFPIRSKKLLVLLGLCYCAFFFIRGQFNMLGIYIFVQDLLIVGFFEEYMYRGLLYTLIKRENKYLAIILSGMLWGISHAVYPTVLSGGGLSAFVSAAFSNIGMGLAIGYGFIYLLESSNTLWVPILLHGLYDYSMGYGWIFFLGTILYFYVYKKQSLQKHQKSQCR